MSVLIVNVTPHQKESGFEALRSRGTTVENFWAVKHGQLRGWKSNMLN